LRKASVVARGELRQRSSFHDFTVLRRCATMDFVQRCFFGHRLPRKRLLIVGKISPPRRDFDKMTFYSFAVSE
jgi:hypothetical protein